MVRNASKGSQWEILGIGQLMASRAIEGVCGKQFRIVSSPVRAQ